MSGRRNGGRKERNRRDVQLQLGINLFHNIDISIKKYNKSSPRNRPEVCIGQQIVVLIFRHIYSRSPQATG